MHQTQTEPELVDDMWVIRIAQPNGKIQEYRCATEAQAKQLAMVLTAPAPLLS